jgi:hypothetical protein
MASVCADDDHKDTSEYVQPSTYPFHHLFNLGVAALVKSLIVRDKRQIYVSMRSGFVTPDSFFPRFGMSASDFAVWQILIENPRRCLTNSSTGSTAIETPSQTTEVPIHDASAKPDAKIKRRKQ